MKLDFLIKCVKKFQRSLFTRIPSHRTQKPLNITNAWRFLGLATELTTSSEEAIDNGSAKQAPKNKCSESQGQIPPIKKPVD